MRRNGRGSRLREICLGNENQMNRYNSLGSGVAGLLALVLVAAGLPAAFALPAQSMNYQAYLKDALGLPVTGTRSITFRLYSVATGGSPVWSDTLSVNLLDGLFSVDLGRPANPLPKAAMTNPLWLGIDVAGDGEAVPRTALRSVSNAFRAEDADTLQGQSAVDLDQSAHLLDTRNPHHVTAAQVGAATSADITAHAGDPSAHHVKTTDFGELVSGTVSNAQLGTDAVTSSKIKNASIATVDLANGAVTAAKINRTGLDADTLDGIDATGFMPAVTDLWVNTTGDAMSGDLTTTGRIGIGTTAPGTRLHVAGNQPSAVGVFINTGPADTDVYGLNVQATGTGTAFANAASFTATGGTTGGSVFGLQSHAYGFGNSNAYGVFSRATDGATTGREYAFYGVGQGYFSDNVGIGTATPNERLTVAGSTSLLGPVTLGTGGVDRIEFDTLSDIYIYDDMNYLRWYSADRSNPFGAIIVGATLNAFYDYNNSRYVFLSASGGIGIGTSTTANGYAVTAPSLFVSGAVNVGLERVSTVYSLATYISSGCHSHGNLPCYYGSGAVSCPVGKQVIGGGLAGGGARYAGVSRSYPSGSATWTCESSYDIVGKNDTCYAICARLE